MKTVFFLLYFSKEPLGGASKVAALSLQNTTSNKFHLSKVSLAAVLPDMKGMQTPNLYLVTMQVFVL